MIELAKSLLGHFVSMPLEQLLGITVAVGLIGALVLVGLMAYVVLTVIRRQ